MNIIEIFQSFQTQEQAIEYLEKVRWGGEPHCPYCGSLSVGRHASGDRDMAHAGSVVIAPRLCCYGRHLLSRDSRSAAQLVSGSRLDAECQKVSERLSDCPRSRYAPPDGLEHDAAGPHGNGCRPRTGANCCTALSRPTKRTSAASRARAIAASDDTSESAVAALRRFR